MKVARNWAPLAFALVGLLLLFRLQAPNFLAFENLIDLAQQISVNAILAFGLTFCILIGGIDLSVGAIVAFAGTCTVYLMSPGSEGSTPLLGVLPAMAVGLSAALLFGLFNGVCAAWTVIPPFIITLGTMMIARGAALRFNQGMPMHIAESNTFFLAIGNERLLGVIPVPVIIMLVIFAGSAILLHQTSFGQQVYAIGGNREAARYAGVPIARVEVLVYAISSLFAGIAGFIHASQLYSAEPASGVGFELNAIAAAVVGGTSFSGGRGAMAGTLIGAIIIGVLDKGLNQSGVHFSWQYIIKGLVVIAAVLVDSLKRGQR